MLDQYDNFLISLSILITCLLDNIWILLGEVAYWSLLGVKGLMVANLNYQIHPFTGLCLVGFWCDGLGWRHFAWSIAFEMIMIGKTFKTLLLSIIFSLDIYWKTCNTLKSVLLIFTFWTSCNLKKGMMANNLVYFFPIRTLSFNADGSCLLSGSQESIKVWNR